MVDLRLEVLPYLLPTILSGELLGESEQQLVFVSLGALREFAQSVLEVLHGVIPELEEELIKFIERHPNAKRRVIIE